MLPLITAFEIYKNTCHRSHLLEYRGFLLDQIKLLFRSNSNNQNEALLHLPDYVKTYIISKISQFKLKALTYENNLDPDVQAVKFFNSFFKSKKDKPYALLFTKYLYDLYLDFQKRKKKPKSCAIYVDDIKIVFTKKENPFYDFKSNTVAQFYCPNKKTILFQTICSCKGKKVTPSEYFKGKVETKVKIFNFSNFIALLFIYDIERKYIRYRYRTAKDTNYIVIELYLVDKNTFKAFFSHNVLYNETKKHQIFEADLRHIFTLLPSKNLEIIPPDKGEYKNLFSEPTFNFLVNKWMLLETVNVENSKTLMFTL